MSKLLSALQGNASFVLFCLLVFCALIAAAVTVERHVLRWNRPLNTARTITFVAMFSAVAGVLMTLEIPLFFAPSFYQIDFSEVPVLICAFYMGPVCGVVCELLKVVIKLMLKGTSTAFVGDFANFSVSCAMVLPAAIFYHAGKTKKRAAKSLILGTVCMTVFGSLFNAYYLIPKFSEMFGLPLTQIVAMGTAVNPLIHDLGTLVLFAVVPFNLVKAVLVSLVTFLLYKRVWRLLTR